MKVKVSDIITIPYLDGSYIVNEKKYSDNLIDKAEVISNIIITPYTYSLYIVDDNFKIDNESEFINFINLCNEKLVSAVIIPEKLLLKAKKFKFFITDKHCSITIPIIIYPDKLSFFMVVYKIQNFISEYYRSELNKIVEVNNRFSHISLKCPNIKTMIDYFKTVINNPVIIYDELFNIIVSTDNYIHEYEEMPETIEKSFLKNLYFYKQNIVFKNAEILNKECTRVLFPITFDNRDKAFLAVFELNSPLSCIDYTILEICATSILVEMKRVMAFKKIEETHLSNFLYDLIYRKDNKIDDIKHRAEILNINESSYYCAIIFDLHLKDTFSPSNFNTLEEINDIIINNIISYIKNKNKQPIVSKFGKSILILHRMTYNNNASYVEIKDICIRLRNILIKKYEHICINIGIGSIIHNITNVSKSYREALSSLSFGKTLYGDNQGYIISYSDSSLLKIFSKFNDKDLLYELIPENLRKLKKHDTESKSNLIETLSIYLDCNCNAKKASKKMFIHYKTMLYRLEKILNEFDIDLENSNSRLQIEIGLQIINIIDIHPFIESI